MDMTCPKCHAPMRQYERNSVTIDQCTECRGIFLDRGELERLVDAENAWHGARAQQHAQPQHGQPGQYPPPAPGHAQPGYPQQHGYGQPQQHGYGQPQQHGYGQPQHGQHGWRDYDSDEYPKYGHGQHGHHKKHKKESFLEELFD
ncbi:zf-TFIIB domain-containing protein [Catellatospora sp. KI3]|uniref:TFIIB-type zinc ribbon-containing protein n=1 Tax=Catellatospora sp. KI3 TaxID=3041620 RepID=UPI002482E83F|nr:zf-TFIIB domain-containing protein [Catellatospora sp. KI3]MDI1459384.1 zf-TFIIB domain-containing protein [Catellatospora sp. KI3]